jgi:hypothetical protein
MNILFLFLIILNKIKVFIRFFNLKIYNFSSVSQKNTLLFMVVKNSNNIGLYNLLYSIRKSFGPDM